jgi:ketosteroid isomerase-like protein
VSANLDLVRSIYAAWERGDFTTTERLHPEIEFVMVGGPSPGTWTRLAGMAEATSVVINLRISPDLHKATRARAVQEERTASDVIRRALKRDLERESDAPAQSEEPA